MKMLFQKLFQPNVTIVVDIKGDVYVSIILATSCHIMWYIFSHFSLWMMAAELSGTGRKMSKMSYNSGSGNSIFLKE